MSLWKYSSHTSRDIKSLFGYHLFDWKLKIIKEIISEYCLLFKILFIYLFTLYKQYKRHNNIYIYIYIYIYRKRRHGYRVNAARGIQTVTNSGQSNLGGNEEISRVLSCNVALTFVVIIFSTCFLFLCCVFLLRFIRVCLDRTYFAETENWKHCSKIIFKCVNSTVGLIFNEKIDKKWNL